MLTAFLAASFIGCQPQPASITFEGEPLVTVNTLDALPLKKANVLDKAGKPIAQAPKITWTVTPETVAKLDGEKAVKPLANGEATVTATIGTVKGSYQLVVAVPDKVEIVGYDATKPVPVGGSIQLKANVLAGNKPVEGQKVMWKSADDKFATVNNGKVTGVAPGQVHIVASLGTLEAKVLVDVIQGEPVDKSVKVEMKGKEEAAKGGQKGGGQKGGGQKGGGAKKK